MSHSGTLEPQLSLPLGVNMTLGDRVVLVSGADSKIKEIVKLKSSGGEFSREVVADVAGMKASSTTQESPVCIAKTQKPLSDDPKKIGRPEGFEITIREIEIAAGAGFLVPIPGEMMRMPGLPSTPSAELIDINDEGEISGLF